MNFQRFLVEMVRAFNNKELKLKLCNTRIAHNVLLHLKYT